MVDEWNPEKKLRRKKRGPSAHQEHAGALSGRTEDPKREHSLASKQPSTAPYSDGNLLPSTIYCMRIYCWSFPPMVSVEADPPIPQRKGGHRGNTELAQKCSRDGAIPEGFPQTLPPNEPSGKPKLFTFTTGLGRTVSSTSQRKKNAQQGAHSGDGDRDDLKAWTNHGAMESSIEHSVSVSEADQSAPRCHRLRFRDP